MAIQKFGSYTQDEYANSIAHCMPSGRFWRAKWIDGTNLRKLLLGLALELMRTDSKYNQFFSEYVDIENTTYYIEEWEKQLGIPDGCIPVASTLAERRKNILMKIAASGAQNEQDFIDIAAILGITITASNLKYISSWPWTWPHVWASSSDKENRFTLVITFVGINTANSWPWTWPHVWSAYITNVLECIFTALKPATKNISFRYE